jgi:hypothetical protein
MVISVNCRLILYADDSIIADKNQKVVGNKLSLELDSCNRWLIENKLALHPGKCECVLFGSKQKRKKVESFTIQTSNNDSEIKAKPQIKYLGALIDQCLTGADTISNIVKKKV